MKIIISIDCEIDGEWKPEYEDELISKIELPQVVVIGDDYGCAVLFETVTWDINDDAKGETQ